MSHATPIMEIKTSVKQRKIFQDNHVTKMLILLAIVDPKNVRMLLLLILQIVNVTHISLVAFLEDIIVFNLTNFVQIGMEVNQSARHLQLIISNVLDFQIFVEIRYVLIYKLPI